MPNRQVSNPSYTTAGPSEPAVPLVFSVSVLALDVFRLCLWFIAVQPFVKGVPTVVIPELPERVVMTLMAVLVNMNVFVFIALALKIIVIGDGSAVGFHMDMSTVRLLVYFLSFDSFV